MSMDAAAMNLADAFEYGQGYVALSRVRSLSGLYLLGLNDRALEVHPKVAFEDAKFRSKSEAALERLNGVDAKKLAEAQTNFIRRCVGTVTLKQAVPRESDEVSTYEKTRELALQKLQLAEIAAGRNLTIGTIIAHLEKLAAARRIDLHRELPHLKPEQKRFEKIKTAFRTVATTQGGKMPLSSVREILGEGFNYEELRLARL